MDEFEKLKSLSVTRSLYGIFLQPIRLGVERNNVFTSTRFIVFGPDSIDANLILSNLIDTNVEGSVYGVTSVGPYGNKVRTFYVMIYLGYYHTFRQVSDCSGQCL